MSVVTYRPERPCRRGHWLRYETSGHCVECQRSWYEANKEAALAKRRQWHVANPERSLALSRKWRHENRDRRLQRAAQYKREHRGDAAASTAKRRAKRLQSTPAWLTAADHRRIKETYARAVHLSRETGIKHHVDHIVPLRGRNVCGLHVPWNLRAIPWIENLRKSVQLTEEHYR